MKAIKTLLAYFIVAIPFVLFGGAVLFSLLVFISLLIQYPLQTLLGVGGILLIVAFWNFGILYDWASDYLKARDKEKENNQ